MTQRDAREILDKVCDGTIQLSYTDHFWKRVAERVPGLERNSVYQALRKGVIKKDPVHDEKHSNYKVEVRAKLPDFGVVDLVVGIAWLDDAIAITIWDVKS